VSRSFRALCVRLRLPPDLVRQVFVEEYAEHGGDGPVALLETGRISREAFGVDLAAALSARSGIDVSSERLVEELFAEVVDEERMFAGVARARRAGVRTGLLSNSWGLGGYARDRFEELFDAVVISGEVGLRKPDPAIFALAASRLGLEPGGCVFVDDLGANVRVAEALGMAGIVHRSPQDTLVRLEPLLGLPTATLTGG
jgi:epoxide hydrolase-like predicted phosphatase